MNFIRYINSRKLFRLGYIIALLIMLLLSFLTYYGQNSGNFVMTVDKEAFKRGIAISETKGFETWNRWLTADPVENVKDVSLPLIKINDIVSTDGPFRENKSDYLAYTFYVKNIGEEVTSIDYEIAITNQSKNITKAIRVLFILDGEVIKDDSGYDYLDYERFDLYQREDETLVEYDDPKLREAKLFESPELVCRESIHNIRPNQAKKISIIMWLEGEDPDCTSELFGSKIKIEMNLEIPQSKEK